MGSDAGGGSLVARRAHNPKVAGSNPAPATQESLQTEVFLWPDGQGGGEPTCGSSPGSRSCGLLAFEVLTRKRSRRGCFDELDGEPAGAGVARERPVKGP